MITKEKYDKVINSDLTYKGKIITAILIIFIISLPILIFPLTGVIIYDILLSILIIATTITVTGITY